MPVPARHTPRAVDPDAVAAADLEAAATAALRAEGLAGYAWGNGPHDVYAPHHHTYDKVIYCLAGSIRFDLPAEGTSVELAPGDRLVLAAGTTHAAVVGPVGVTCLEAHR